MAEPTLQELKKRIAELEQDEPTGEAEQTEELNQPSSGGLWDFKLPADWKPEPRYLKEKDCEDRSKDFRIGDWYVNESGKKEHRQAYPRPSYRDAGGKPGDEITNELSREFAHLHTQWFHSCTDLESCIQYTKQKLQSSAEIDGCPWLNAGIECWEDSTEKRRLAEKWNYLCGLWTAKRMDPPSEQQLEKWARGQE